MMALPLIVATINNCPEGVKILLSRGAKLEIADSYGKTASMYAAQSCHKESLRALLEIASRQEKLSTLGVASYYGNSECVRIAIEVGANIDGNDSGCTALVVSASRGHLEVMKTLLAAEAGENNNFYNCFSIIERYEK